MLERISLDKNLVEWRPERSCGLGREKSVYAMPTYAKQKC